MPRLPDSFLEEIRARTPLAALVGRRTKLSRSGRNWKGCCPFHGEKTPSFYVYDDGYHCFGCGAHGDAIGFVMHSQNANFMEAVELLAGEAGMDVPKPSPEAVEAEQKRLSLHDILESVARIYQDNLRAPQGAAALAYLRGRGLTDETIRRFGLGYSGDGRGALLQRLGGTATPAQLHECGLLRDAEDGGPGRELFYNRVMFPIRDRRGRVISFGGRIMGDGQPKYVNGPETALFSKRRALYALDFAREAARGGAPVVAVEGYMDVIALHQAGFAGAVAPLGTALTEDQLALLWQLSPAPVLCFDGDGAGARAAARAIDIALPGLTAARTIRIATLPAGEDPDTLVRTRGAEAFTAVLDAARPFLECLFALRSEAASAITDRERQRATLSGALEADAARIGDRALAWEYRRSLRKLFAQSGYDTPRKPRREGARAAGFGERPPSFSGPLARPKLVESAADTERTRHLTAILLRHPALLPRLEEAFAQLALPASSRRLFGALQGWVDGAESLDFNTLINHLSNLRLTDDAAWALGDTPLPLPVCASPATTVVEAEAGWWRIYGLMRRDLLEAELAAARRECAASFTAEAVQRVTALAGALLGRAGDEPGSELGSDD